MSDNRRVYQGEGRAPGMSRLAGQNDFTCPTGEPRAGEGAGLGEQAPGADQNPTAAPESGQPEYRGGYSVIAPNQSRRSHLQTMANRELEELRQWKEANRPGPINLTPTQLGGVTSEAEARQRQQINLQGSKFQRRARKAEHDRQRKEAEELEIQKKKEIQREKANKLAEKRRQEDEQRKSQLQAEHHQANQQFLQRIETNRSYSHSPLPPNHTVPTTSWAKSQTYRETQREAEQQKLRELKEEQRKKSELLAEKESQQETERQRRLQEEHRKKNKSFLDNLERRQLSDENSHRFAPPSSDEESFEHDSKQHVTASNCYEDRREDEQVCSGAMIGDSACRDSAKDTDYDWNLMKLQSCFPDYEVTVLEELLLQCDGDHESLIRLLQ